MKRLASLLLWPALVAGFLLGAPEAQAQCTGTPNANTICAGPSSGGAGFPNFRNMVTGDIPAGTIANSNLANMPAGTVKANPTGSSAPPIDWNIGASSNVNSSGLPGFSGQQLYIFRAPSAVDANQATLRVDRSATYTGGTPGNVMNAIFGYMAPSAGVADYQWAILGQVDNSATGGQNVGVYGQGNKMTSGAGPTWGGVMQAVEQVATTNPTTGTVGLEIDLKANNTDTSGNRVILDLVGQKGVGATIPTITYGMRIGAGGPTTSQFTTGVFFAGGTVFDRGIDLTAGSYTTAAIKGTGFLIDGSGNLTANNITNAWTTFTPSPSCGTATFTVNSARFHQVGKTTSVSFDVTITAIGTCSGNTFNITLPNTANSTAGMSGKEFGTTGFAVPCVVTGASATLACSRFDGTTTWAVNNRIAMSGTYENQ